MDILFVLVCAGLAGFVDAIVGGGRQPGFLRPILDWDITPLDATVP